jgi:hypothetical protein
MAGHFLLSPAARDFTLEFVEKMSAATVHAFFVRNRWGDDGTQVCPECGSIDKHYWIKTRRQWRCRDVACGRMFSVTSGTKWADHKLPLKTILKGMVLFATNVKGISASALGRQLGVAYQTAFVLLSKLRESIMECANKNKLDGLVHIDGAHVSGRIRKPRVKEKATRTQAREKIGYEANAKHPNRRIVMVMREVDPHGHKGAIRTIVEVVRAENRKAAEALAKQYITHGARVMTDESNAYGMFMARYDHATVNHEVEFSTDDGVSNNQAESFFSRMRRMAIGQVHRITPKYMLDYVTEIAWREDQRRTRTSEQVRQLLAKSTRSMSRWWRGYWQGKMRQEEIMFAPPA